MRISTLGALTALVMLPLPALATTATFCGPDNGTGCELPGEVKVFLNEIHDSSTITGNVGGQNSGPVIVITADSGTFDSFLDAGGGFATIDPSHGFKAFNGVDITIPGFTFTDIVFTVQMTRQGGKKGDSETDTFTINPFSGLKVSDGVGTESDSPDAAFEFNAVAHGGVFDEVNLLADGPPLSGGFDEIKHIQISGLAAVATPEPSTWVMLVAGFGIVGLMARRRLVKRLA
jgi:hypothetical protein